MIGTRFAEMLGLTRAGTFEEDQAEAYVEELVRRLADPLAIAGREGSASADVQVERADGQVRTLRCKLLGLTSGGVLVQVRDLRELTSLVADLRLAAHHRNLNRLYASAAHDLKSPLNALSLQVELLTRTVRRGGDGDRATRALELADQMRDEIDRLQGLIEETLSQTAPDAGTPESTDLDELCAGIARQLATMTEAQGVDVRLESEGPARVDVLVQPLRQALMNLAVNACEAMPDGGRLTLRSGFEAGSPFVEVGDTGPGIDPRVLTQLFELHVTTKDSGTGIGLWSARSTIEGLGGSLDLVPASRGACFRITLPPAPLDSARTERG